MDWLGDAWSGVKRWAGDVFGGGSSSPVNSYTSIGTQVGNFAGDYLANRNSSPFNWQDFAQKAINTVGSMPGQGGSGYQRTSAAEQAANVNALNNISFKDLGGGTFIKFADPAIVFQNPSAATGSGGSAKGPSTADRIKGAAIDVGKAFLTKVLLGGLCDIRTKVDVSPLETTDVNNDLAEIAFFVKEIRECS